MSPEALGKGQQDCWPESPGLSCREEAALEVPTSCSATKIKHCLFLCQRTLFRVVAEDGPTIYGPCLLQQPPKTGSTWFVSFLKWSKMDLNTFLSNMNIHWVISCPERKPAGVFPPVGNHWGGRRVIIPWHNLLPEKKSFLRRNIIWWKQQQTQS